MAPNVDSRPQFDPNIQSEDIAFKASEMIVCDKCGRTNPPNRAECLYCGCQFVNPTESAPAVKLNLRNLESWEPGWNVIAKATSPISESDIASIAGILGRETGEIVGLLETNRPLPLARVESESKAGLLAARLAQLGVESRILADADLNPEKPPVRLRRIDFQNGSLDLHDFNTGQIARISADDLALLVTGNLVSSRTDLIEKRRLRGGRTVIDETATSSDEAIVDIYRRNDPAGFRVRLVGFDFSCLGDEKAILATENFRRLVGALEQFSPRVILVNDYPRVRPLLDGVWKIESRKDPQGLRRAGFARKEFGSVASTSNITQFTKFSRLQWHLL